MVPVQWGNETNVVVANFVISPLCSILVWCQQAVVGHGGSWCKRLSHTETIKVSEDSRDWQQSELKGRLQLLNLNVKIMSCMCNVIWRRFMIICNVSCPCPDSIFLTHGVKNNLYKEVLPLCTGKTFLGSRNGLCRGTGWYSRGEVRNTFEIMKCGTRNL